MTEFKPPISERGTEDLIAIAYSTTEMWQQTAIDQAHDELRKRAIPKEFIQKVLDEWEEEERQVEIAYQKQLEANALEGYTIPIMAYIVLATPFILAGKWTVDLSLTELKEGNFKKKFRQRLLLLLGGLVFWFVVIAMSIK